MLEALSHLSTGAMWCIFALVVGTILYLDLFVFHKKAEKTSFKNTFFIALAYMCVALVFGLFVMLEKGVETGWLYYTGYLVEFSLSMDNIFVMSLVFSALKVAPIYQHRVLFWGVLGAIFMRAVMILLGAQLVSSFHFVLYLFSAFLIYTGAKMLFQNDEKEAEISESKIIRFLKRFMHVTPDFHGEHFFVKERSKWAVTPLFFALISIELMDIVFAIDSIPAIFLITQDVFVVYTSNIFAILGLRTLYFLLAAAVSRFVYLKHALSLVLIFIGLKIFLPHAGITITNGLSLMVTFGLLLSGVLASLYLTGKKQKLPK